MIRRALPLAAIAALLAPATAGASSEAPRASLSATPVRLALAGAARGAIRVSNPGTTTVVVDASRGSFGLDLRGRPRVLPRGRVARSASSWLTVTPSRLELAPGTAALLTVSSRIPRGAEPGDHHALVLLTSHPAAASGVAVRMRLGVVVAVTVPGAIVHRIVLRRLTIEPAHGRQTLTFEFENRGNVTEHLRRTRVRIRRSGRVVLSLSAPPRDLLPRTRGVVELRSRGRISGLLTAIVETPGAVRMFRVHL